MTEVLLPLLATPNPAGAREFYGALFGWTFGVDGMDAFLDGDRVAGITPAAGLPAGWLTYLATSDVDMTTAGAVRLGATVVRQEARAAIVRDPTGAAIGFGQRGAPVVYQPGAACWHELVTDDLDGSDEFYTGLFPLTLQEIEDGTAVLRRGHYRPVGGRRRIVGKPRWQTYFWVEDLEAAMVRVTELGGTVRYGPLDSHHGSLAGVSDPFGAHCTLIVPTGW